MNATATSPSNPPRIGRSIFAVVAGFGVTFVITTVTDGVMHASGIFPAFGGPPMGNGLFALALGYRIVFDVIGAALAARLAPSRPMTHALVLGAIGTVLCIIGAIAMWDLGPAWYSLGLAASALPTAWLGAKLSLKWARPEAA